MQDLNRQIVKSDAASFSIPELEFESPAFSQKGGMFENSSVFFSVVLTLHFQLTSKIGVKMLLNSLLENSSKKICGLIGLKLCFCNLMETQN